ncbi:MULTISPECIES: Gfo/Idh/MocA family protein [unclassified Streptomyces]|uniref:Gfo/Idh/MocA family protein n=1 Tax=unclassified Streptomyces TaxID=2593676 RepID=UPI00224D81B3|nr:MULTISPECIES: Gfo/Idh/MocA family oxidoreductase [unclassified Streptomyces]MCX5058020.1 Gfo/Idh/MocA family oxidoreductase [Streptomyces sp. NBC_00452]MCX5245102.1 Gfo/Idh/MocA family oxidoreductase [Streptomyces sp. NBC_00201]MCX5289168.1 Gfo/Idh/MocA family oxidoreductase [Streptomyces sp. NBC_00183]
MTVPIVLAGARGHGRWHLDNIRRLQDKGVVRLAGICELTPLTGEEIPDGLGTPEQSADFGALLDSTGARIAVVCTPIPTHADLALTAAGKGVHLLLEKPPAPSYAEFRRMADGIAEAGVACQIGFQSLGSHAVPAILGMVAEGAIGEVVGVGGAGAWARAEAYYRRAPWAGRRRLNGVDVIDGVLTNPLAHAVATALALNGTTRAEDVTGIETELLRANDIESDDTSCVRVTTAHGGRVTVAATLCAEDPGEPYVVVHGTGGRITFWYKQDRVLLQRAGHGPEEYEYGSTDLLENLADHLTDGTGLLVTPASTGAFMKVVEAIRLAPDPAPLPAGAWHLIPDEDRRVVPGIDGLVAAAADTLALYSELGAPWALPKEPST